jgi:antitoxin component YwqK of YwqJK toxin-antitoxin module
MQNQIHCSGKKILLLAHLATSLFLFACSEKELSPDDVEYRKDENGTEILYELGLEKPFGQKKRAFIIDYYPGGENHFKIGFVNGLKDGNFTFWRANGLRMLTGSFSQGKRNGLFTAYGKTEELVYQKNYVHGELDGTFKLYYPSSPSDVNRYFDQIKEKNIDPGELPVKNHLRLEAVFSDGKPVGKYRAFYHPRGKKLSLEELLKEEGSFDMNGMLSKEQLSYYPQTHAIVVYMPDNKRLETIHPASSDGFSRAIDEAAREILEIPSYRNPNNAPALIYAIDERGNKIMPIWSSNIKELAIRKMDGFLIETRFNATYEAFVFDARNLAEETLLTIDTSLDPQLPEYDRKGAAVEIVGLDKSGAIIDILWSSNKLSDVIALDERIDRKRTKLKRNWQEGNAKESRWILSNGSKITIKDKNTQANPFQFLR